MGKGTIGRMGGVVVLAVALAATSEAATIGINNVNLVDQVAYPGAGGAGEVYYNAVTGQPCGVNDPNREDGWGIFKISSILDWATADTLWNGNMTGEEMFGIYYGRIDDSVGSGSSGRAFKFQSQTIYFAVYMNPSGTFAAAGGTAQGSAGRTEFDQYKGITGGTLLFGGVINTVLDANTSFSCSFTPNGGSTGLLSDIYDGRLAVTDGEWADRLGDYLILSGNARPTNIGNWTKTGSGSFMGEYMSGWAIFDMNTWDMTTQYATDTIPEPATLTLLTAGGLALLRRWRRG